MTGSTILEQPRTSHQSEVKIRRESMPTDSPSPYNMPQAYYPARYTHQPQYNSSGEYDVFQTPPSHRFPQPVIYQSRDTTIPQYYPVMAERSWSQTPDKGKRKREPKLKTPKKTEERASKRIKAASQGSQLPTPPSTGRDLPAVLPPHLQPLPQPVPERRGVKVLQSEEEGRKLAVGQVLDDDEVVPPVLPQRLAPAPTIITGATGVAALTTHPILESELAWLENGRPATPTESYQEDGMEEKTEKRLQAFAITARTEPMMCTTIDAFGRVAVRKDTAMKFLGLESAASVEETENDEWVPVASSSKPNWPDNWNGGRIRMREDREREVLLRRYMEYDGEDSEEEYTDGKGKGKSVAHLVAPDPDPRRRIRVEVNADAKSALLTALRYRALPPLPVGVVACACGARSANGISAMVVCTNCQTWHHTLCNGIDDMQLPARWWCPNCENQVLNLSTPAQTPRRAYAQSEERSSAFKGQADHIALAPSPIFAGPSVQTPANRGVASPTSRNHRSRILSYGTDMWAYGEEPGGLPTPSTPVPADTRFTTPRIDDAPFDVTSTPSRHIDFNFGNPSLFSLTPLGRPRVPSNMMSDTPLTYRQRLTSHSEGMGGRHDFLRDLAGPSAPLSPSSAARRGTALLGASSIGSSMGHRRTLSGNKMSSMRNSSRSGLGLGMPIGANNEDDDDELPIAEEEL